MGINWDIIISSIIIIWIFLVMAAKITKQSVPELLEGIKEFAVGSKEEALERGEELLYYD